MMDVRVFVATIALLSVSLILLCCPFLLACLSQWHHRTGWADASTAGRWQ